MRPKPPTDRLASTPLPTAPLEPGAAREGVPLTAADHELVAAANEVLARHYRPFWHMVAAAIRGRDGRIWTGVHLGATVGRLSVCAEAVALGRAVLEGDGMIHTAVAVRHPKPEETDREMAVVAPCGACREMIVDFSPEALVILKAPEGLVKLPVRALLPMPYRR
jgi:cytidine deaminase